LKEARAACWWTNHRELWIRSGCWGPMSHLADAMRTFPSPHPWLEGRAPRQFYGVAVGRSIREGPPRDCNHADGTTSAAGAPKAWRRVARFRNKGSGAKPAGLRRRTIQFFYYRTKGGRMCFLGCCASIVGGQVVGGCRWRPVRTRPRIRRRIYFQHLLEAGRAGAERLDWFLQTTGLNRGPRRGCRT